MSERVGHITFTPMPNGRVLAECGKCSMGLDAPPKFGFIPQEELVKAWVKQHTHKPKTSRASHRREGG